MCDDEKMQTFSELMSEIEKGRESGDQMGWLDNDAVEARLGVAAE